MIRTAPDRRNSSPGLDTYSDRRTAPPSLVVVLALNVLSMLQTWRERARSRRELAARSDRELQDIGASQSSISKEISKPFWRA
jgi:uncharacterized protein YjiS (DUF1127 family)